MKLGQDNRHRVAIGKVQSDDVERAVRDTVGMAGGFEDVVRPGSKVLVKPNLCRPERPGTGIVTDMQVVEAVTRMVLERSPASVVIGEGAIAGFDDGSVSTEEAFEVSGVAEVGRRLGVECRNLNADGVAQLAVSDPLVLESIRVARTVVESDVVVSVPVLKSHLRTMATVSLKNMWGMLPGAEKRVGHLRGLDGAIVDLLSVAAPSYAVVDATTAIEGLWRAPQECQPLGLILAGHDPFLVDVAGVRLMGMDPLAVGYLRRLVDTGRVSELEEVPIVGEPLEDHTYVFRKAFDAFMDGYQGVHVAQGRWACSGCTNDLVGALRYMAGAGYCAEMEGLTVLIGRHDSAPAGEKVVVIGSCAETDCEQGYYIRDCPPAEEDIIRAICQACGSDPDRVLRLKDETRTQLWESTRHLLLR
jgi:uncharacterized protein (DUF362 family)